MANSREVRIVIAEDSAADVILFKEALRSVGVNADLKVFSDGERCADHFRTTDTSPPDLIVLDLNLPKVSGFDLIRLIRSDPQYDNVPVAVLTSSPREEDRVLSLDLGANVFVTKPSRLGEFLETVGSAILAQLDRTDGTATLTLILGPGPISPAGRRRRHKGAARLAGGSDSSILSFPRSMAAKRTANLKRYVSSCRALSVI